MKRPSTFLRRAAALLADSSPCMLLVGRVALLVVLNLCWLLCSLPVVTAGAATAALYHILSQENMPSYFSACPAFFRAFRRYFKSAVILWLPFLGAGALLLLDWYALLLHQWMDNPLLLTPLLLAAAVWAVTLLWLWPLLVCRRGRREGAVRRALLLGLRELWRSLAALALNAIPTLLFLFYARTFMVLWGFWLLLGFALPAQLTLLLFRPVLKKEAAAFPK